MIDFWGTDIVFLDGFNCDITVLHAILDVTELFEKDGRVCFSVVLADVPHPVHMVCNDLAAAQTYHQYLAAKIEQRRRRAGLQQLQTSLSPLIQTFQIANSYYKNQKTCIICNKKAPLLGIKALCPGHNIWCIGLWQNSLGF